MKTRKQLTRRDERFNAWLSVALLAAIVVVGNALARERCVIRRDLSEDQLFTVAPATQRILRGLEDRLQVRTYFTRDTAFGDVALARARIEAQLAEFKTLAGDRMEVIDFDPVTSTAARSDAQRAGVRPYPERRNRGTETIEEDVWRGLTLRFRGREQVIPFVHPWRFEVQFASAVHALTRARRVVVGLVNAPLAAAPPPRDDPNGRAAAYIATAWPTYAAVSGELQRSRDVRPLIGLAEGTPVPNDVDVVVVIASEWMHPRAVFELDRFVQRGGSLVVAVDDPVFNWITGYGRSATPESPLESELGRMLRAYGADVREKHVWDPEGQTVHGVLRAGSPPAAVESPAVITVLSAGLSASMPPTRDLPQVAFFWAHPIVDAQRNPPPPGVRREDLAWASPRARLAGTLDAIPADARTIADIDRSVRPDPGFSYVLAAAFTGALPSAFEGRAVPLARDPSTGPDAVLDVPPAALPEGATPASGAVVVVGDADWLRDPAGANDVLLIPFAQAGGALLLENLVDWLTLDDDLIALRSRVPRERPLLDFEREAFSQFGLLDPDPFQTDAERREREHKVDAARSSARWRRWRTILAPIGAALALVAALGVSWNVAQRRRTVDRAAPGPESGPGAGRDASSGGRTA